MAVYSQGGKIIDGGDASGNLESLVVDIQGATVCGLELYSASATRAGTINVQESVSGSNWASVEITEGGVTSADVTVTAGAALTKVYNLAGLGGKFLKVIFTNSAGTGTLDAYLIRKD